MTKIIHDRKIVEDDWQTLPDDAPLPGSGRVVVSLKRWQEIRDAAKTGDAVFGVRIPNNVDVVELWPALRERPLIAVEFPAFGDGRAYSQARLLRERFDYKGEIRAVGDVLRDEIFFMHRCGINAMIPRADQDLQELLVAFGDFKVPYQAAADAVAPVVRRRQAGETSR